MINYNDYNNKVPGVSLDDLEQLSEIIDDMKSDSYIYEAAIATAAVNVVTKTTALISQTATAAANSGTLGFTAAITLDIKGDERDTSSSTTTSRASNLNSSNLIIKTNEDKTITLQGSNITADNAEMTTGTLNIVASKDTHTQEISNKGIEASVTMGISMDGMNGLSANASGSKDKEYVNNTTYNNSSINIANNFIVTTKENMNIDGGNILVGGRTTTNIGGDLNIISKIDVEKSKSSSYSLGAGVSSAGDSSISANGSISIDKTTLKTVVESSFISESADITVDGNTNLVGATLATGTYDENGVYTQNDNLTLKTTSITNKDLSNTVYKKGNSMGGGTSGDIVNVNTSSNYTFNKTKTLATLGTGDITLTDKDATIDEKLNRDSQTTNKVIFNASQETGIDLSVDTRLLSESGRNEIKEEMKKTKVGFYDVAKDIITSDSLTILDSFSHQGNKVDMYDGVQNAIKNSADLQEKLADPTITKEEKNDMLRVIASSVAKELNIKLADVSVISTNKQTQDNKEIQGGYHEPSGDIAINDKNINNTGEAINTLGHELAHSLDDQRGETRQGTTQSGQSYSDEYANIMGDSLQDYAEFGMDNYTDKTLATTNEHIGLKTPTDNEVFDGRVENGEIEFDTAYSIYHDNEKKVQEIVTFKQLQQEQLANHDFEGAKATGEEIARLDNDVEAFQNENGTGNQAVQNVFDEFDKIDETNVAVVETVVTIVGGRKLLKEVSDVSDDVVLSTGIKVNNTIQNKVIPAVKDGYYRAANVVLDPENVVKAVGVAGFANDILNDSTPANTPYGQAVNTVRGINDIIQEELKDE